MSLAPLGLDFRGLTVKIFGDSWFQSLDAQDACSRAGALFSFGIHKNQYPKGLVEALMKDAQVFEHRHYFDIERQELLSFWRADGRSKIVKNVCTTFRPKAEVLERTIPPPPTESGAVVSSTMKDHVKAMTKLEPELISYIAGLWDAPPGSTAEHIAYILKIPPNSATQVLLEEDKRKTARTKELCPICLTLWKKSDAEMGVTCDTCHHWVHYSCDNQLEEGREATLYTCPKCVQDPQHARYRELVVKTLPELHALARNEYDIRSKPTKAGVVAQILAYERRDSARSQFHREQDRLLDKSKYPAEKCKTARIDDDNSAPAIALHKTRFQGTDVLTNEEYRMDLPGFFLDPKLTPIIFLFRLAIVNVRGIWDNLGASREDPNQFGLTVKEFIAQLRDLWSNNLKLANWPTPFNSQQLLHSDADFSPSVAPPCKAHSHTPGMYALISRS